MIHFWALLHKTVIFEHTLANSENSSEFNYHSNFTIGKTTG